VTLPAIATVAAVLRNGDCRTRRLAARTDWLLASGTRASRTSRRNPREGLNAFPSRAVYVDVNPQREVALYVAIFLLGAGLLAATIAGVWARPVGEGLACVLVVLLVYAPVGIYGSWRETRSSLRR